MFQNIIKHKKNRNTYSQEDATINKTIPVIEAITPINKLNKVLGGSEEAVRGHTLRKSTQEIKNLTNYDINDLLSNSIRIN